MPLEMRVPRVLPYPRPRIANPVEEEVRFGQRMVQPQVYSGEVAIGTNTVPSGYQLAVDGDIRTREIRVDQDNWPDYVFDEDYDLPTLEEIKSFIEANGHLPNIPSAEEVTKNGADLGKMDRLLLEKIEQLTLFAIQQNRLLEKQQEELNPA